MPRPPKLRSASPIAKRLDTCRRRTLDAWRRAHLTYVEAVALAADVRGALELERPGRGRRVVDRLNGPEVAALLAAAYRLEPRHGLLVKTTLLTGARVSELVGLRVGDFDAEELTITFRAGKGDKDRRVPILPELGQALQVHLGGRRRGWLFEKKNATPYTARRVQQIVAAAAAEAGLVKRVHPHLLRHTIAQHLLEGGMALEQVQRFLGHERPDTTQIYAESTPIMIRDSYRRALGAAPHGAR